LYVDANARTRRHSPESSAATIAALQDGKTIVWIDTVRDPGPAPGR
jgi:hypothetical protein